MSLSILNWIIQTNKMIFYLIFYVVLYDMATPAPCLSIYATSPCFSQQHRVVYVIKVCPERTGCPKILQPLSLSNFLADKASRGMFYSDYHWSASVYYKINMHFIHGRILSETFVLKAELKAKLIFPKQPTAGSV